MNKKFFNRILMGVLFVASAISFGSCEDWEGEINNLQGQIDQIEASLEEIQAKVNAGERVADVKTNDEGVVLVMGDGSEFVIKHGKDGANGADGKNATVWTIGEDGFWYQDGVKTEFKAIGVDGAKGDKGDKGDKGETGAAGAKGDKGDKGDKGETGATGAKGDTYYPATDGFWYVISGTDTTKVEPEMSWRAQCISAVVEGNVLRLSGVEGFEGEVEIELGAQLGSVAFLADTYSKDLPALATHADPFLHVGNLVFGGENASWAPVNSNDWMSNVVELPYRLNPGNTFIPESGLLAGFVAVDAKQSTSRAFVKNVEGMFDAVEAISEVNAKGEFAVAAKLTQPELVANHNCDGNDKTVEHNFLTAALEVYQGTHVVVSDYIRVLSDHITAQIAVKDLKDAKVNHWLPKREIALEKIATVKDGSEYTVCALPAIVSLANVNLEVVRGTSVDLTTKVWLADVADYVALVDKGFENVDYTFTLINTNAQGGESTEQEYYASLSGDNFTVSDKASVVGKKPVVRVDATVEGQLVASAYAVIEIVDTPSSAQEDYKYTLEAANLLYSQTTDAGILASEMKWLEASEKIYDALDVTSVGFWTLYENPVVKIVSTEEYKEGDATKTREFVWFEGQTNSTASATVNGFASPVVTLYPAVDEGTRNNTFDVKVNNKIATDASLVNGLHIAKDGEYTITLTFKRKDIYNTKKYKDVILTQVVTVKQDWVAYTLNPANAIGNVVTANGYLNAAGKLASRVDQHFINAIKDGDKKSIFTGRDAYNANLGGGYLNIDETETLNSFQVVDPTCAVKNCASAQAATCTDGTTTHIYTGSKSAHHYLGTDGKTAYHDNADMVDGEVVLNIALPADLKVDVTYNTVFVNGDTKKYDYVVNFVSPLKAVAAAAEKLYINKDKDAVNLEDLVNVYRNIDDVLIWKGDYKNSHFPNAAAEMGLTTTHVLDFTVVNDGGFGKDYEQNSTFGTRKPANADWELFFENNGKTVFNKDYNATVKATVTVGSANVALYTVTIDIPVVLTKDNEPSK